MLELNLKNKEWKSELIIRHQNNFNCLGCQINLKKYKNLQL